MPNIAYRSLKATYIQSESDDTSKPALAQILMHLRCFLVENWIRSSIAFSVSLNAPRILPALSSSYRFKNSFSFSVVLFAAQVAYFGEKRSSSSSKLWCSCPLVLTVLTVFTACLWAWRAESLSAPVTLLVLYFSKILFVSHWGLWKMVVKWTFYEHFTFPVVSAIFHL